LKVDDACYRTFPLPDLADLMALIHNENLRGFNVTIPHKTAIIPFLTNISNEASIIGAVNTVSVETKESDVLLHGYNTDAPAFEQTLKSLALADSTKALVLGTGGASLAVTFVLKKMNVPFTLVSRTADTGTICYETLSAEIIAQHRIIINTTPVGMAPETQACPNIPYEGISNKHIAYDLIYNPEQSLFLQKSAAQGAQIMNGMKMLQLQADLAWEIWSTH
jgi:shikimate dehydrogenase